MLEDASACPRFFRGIKRENKESIPGAPCPHYELFLEVTVGSDGFPVVLDCEDFWGEVLFESSTALQYLNIRLLRGRIRHDYNTVSGVARRGDERAPLEMFPTSNRVDSSSTEKLKTILPVKKLLGAHTRVRRFAKF